MKDFDDRYLKSIGYFLLVSSYLDGTTLFHKIALLNKIIRKILPDSALLDQIIVLTIKK